MTVLSNLLRAVNAMQHEFDTIEEKITEQGGVSPVKEKCKSIKLDVEGKF
jgi:hypothetical protein